MTKKLTLSFLFLVFSLLSTDRSYALLKDLNFKSGSYEFKLNIPEGFCYYDINRISEEIPLIDESKAKDLDEDTTFGMPSAFAEIMLKITHSAITDDFKKTFNTFNDKLPPYMRQKFIALVPTCIGLSLNAMGVAEIPATGFFHIFDNYDSMKVLYENRPAKIRMMYERKKMLELVKNKSPIDEFVRELEGRLKDDPDLTFLEDGSLFVENMTYLGTTRVKKKFKSQNEDNCFLVFMRQPDVDQIMAQCFIDDSTFSIQYVYASNDDIAVLKGFKDMTIDIVNNIE